MSHQWDDFSKSLAENSVPRRESLRLLGAALAGAVLSPLGLGTAWGGRQDPCKAFCRCSNRTQQNQCLSACRACNGQTGRLAGSCGKYVCCKTAACRGVCSDLKSNPNCGACGNDCRDFGEKCCGSYCADLENDFNNCGACGVTCDQPGPNAQGACVSGQCIHWCVAGAQMCNGNCTLVNSDPDNCGECGNVCPGSAPYCNQWACSEDAPYPAGFTLCGDHCTDLTFDNANCGACGVVCPNGWSCQGVCTPVDF